MGMLGAIDRLLCRHIQNMSVRSMQPPVNSFSYMYDKKTKIMEGGKFYFEPEPAREAVGQAGSEPATCPSCQLAGQPASEPSILHFPDVQFLGLPSFAFARKRAMLRLLT